MTGRVAVAAPSIPTLTSMLCSLEGSDWTGTFGTNGMSAEQ